MDYFPLSIDYEERFYAAGKISGSRYIKREGRPSDEAVLIGRIIDRPIVRSGLKAIGTKSKALLQSSVATRVSDRMLLL